MDPYSAGPAGGNGRGYIPPPPEAHFESGGEYNPFPGKTQTNYTRQPPASAPSWLAPAQASPSPWAPNWPYARPGNWSPYSHPTPAGGGYHASGLGQPITSSPWFNAGWNRASHEEWPSSPRDPGWNVAYDVPLERTHSPDPPYPPSPWHHFAGDPLTRSWSTRAVTGSVNGAGSYDEYDSDYLARRPRDYRPGFGSRRRFLSIHRHKSEVQEFRDPTKRTLSDLLRYNRPVTDVLLYKPSDIHVSYDLRYPPNPEALTFPNLRRPPNYLDLAQLATSPPAERMRLFHPLLPWYIEVQQSQANGITVYDVLVQMFDELQRQINERHYFNEELNSATREMITRAYTLRTKDWEEQRAEGVKRVDYLGNKVIFLGLVRTTAGRWEMKTGP